MDSYSERFEILEVFTMALRSLIGSSLSAPIMYGFIEVRIPRQNISFERPKVLLKFSDFFLKGHHSTRYPEGLQAVARVRSLLRPPNDSISEPPSGADCFMRISLPRLRRMQLLGCTRLDRSPPLMSHAFAPSTIPIILDGGYHVCRYSHPARSSNAPYSAGVRSRPVPQHIMWMSKSLEK